jgi:hypothetical protein
MRAAALPALLLLAACGNLGGGDLTRTVLGLGGEPDRLAIAEAESAEVEAPATLRLGLGRRTATAALVHTQGQRRLWRAPGGVVVATDGGRVVASSGLPTMIMATRFDGPDPLADPRSLLERSAEARRLVDLSGAARDPASMRFGIAFDCRLRAARTDQEGVILVEERCRASGLSPVTNLFWVDEASGQVAQAEQWVGPGLGPMRLDFTE